MITCCLSFHIYVVCPYSVYGLWLPIVCPFTFTLSVLLQYTAYDYLLFVLSHLRCLYFFSIRLMITCCLSFHIYVVCTSSVYGLWLPIVCPFTFTLSVLLQYTAYDYLLFVLSHLRCLYFFSIRLMITYCLSFHIYVVCTSSVYGLWLFIVCPFTFTLSVLLQYTAYDYLLFVLSHLRCLSFFGIRLMITCCLSFHIYVVCPSSVYGLWLPVVCPFTFTLSILLRYTAYNYLLFVLSHLRCLYFFSIRLMITCCLSFHIYVVCPSSVYGLWLPVVCPFTFTLSVLLQYTAYDYLLFVLSHLRCLYFFSIRLMITCCLSFHIYVVCTSSVYGLWLPVVCPFHIYVVCTSSVYGLWLPVVCPFTFTLSVLLPYTAYGYLLFVLSHLRCLSIFSIRLMITYCLSFHIYVVCTSSVYGLWLPVVCPFTFTLSVLLQYTAYGYLLFVHSHLRCLYFFSIRLMITCCLSFHIYVVCTSSVYGLWLPVVCPFTFTLSVLLQYTAYDYLLFVLSHLRCLYFLSIRLMVTCCLSFHIYVVCPSSVYGLWLPVVCPFTFTLSVLLQYTAYGYLLFVLSHLRCLYFFSIRLMVTCCLSFHIYVVCPSSVYGLWLPIVCPFTFTLSVLLQYTAYDYLLFVLSHLRCLYFFSIRLMITCCLSFHIYVVCPSSVYGLWLPVVCPFTFTLSVLLQYTAYDYLLFVLSHLRCLSFFSIRLMITYCLSFHIYVVCTSSVYGLWLPVVCPFHIYVVCTSSVYGLWLPVVCPFTFTLSVLLPYTAYGYLLFVLSHLRCLSIFSIRLMITYCLSFHIYVVCTSSVYGLWLPVVCPFTFTLSVLLQYTAYGYLLFVHSHLRCLYFFSIRLMVTCCLSFHIYVVCTSSVYGLWLPVVCPFTFTLSVLLQYTAYDYLLFVLSHLRCLYFLSIRLMVTCCLSFHIYVVCPSSVYGLWLPVVCPFTFTLSVLLQYTAYGYLLFVLSHLRCLYFFSIRLMVTCCLSFHIYVVCPSSVYGLWLPVVCPFTFTLSVLLQYTAYDYLLFVLSHLRCLYFFSIRLMVTCCLSFHIYVVCTSSVYGVWLPVVCPFTFTLSVLLQYTAYGYLLFVHSHLRCLYFFSIRLMITCCLSFHIYVVCTSSVYGLWLPVVCPFTFTLSVLLQYTAYGYLLFVLSHLRCLYFFSIRLMVTCCLFCYLSCFVLLYALFCFVCFANWLYLIQY